MQKPILAKNILANNVLYMRHGRKWSQEELGDRANKSAKFISNVENAKINARIDTVQDIASAFNVNLNELFIYHNYKIIKNRVDRKN